MIDNYHMNIEEADPYAALTAAGPHIKHVQVSGTNRGTPGADHFDWPRFFAALCATGYGGAVCVESFTAQNEAIATAASIWRPLAPSQDLLAVEGLAYLRAVIQRTDRPGSPAIEGHKCEVSQWQAATGSIVLADRRQSLDMAPSPP